MYDNMYEKNVNKFKSISEISDTLKISNQRTRQLLKKAIEKTYNKIKQTHKNPYDAFINMAYVLGMKDYQDELYRSLPVNIKKELCESLINENNY